MVKLCRQTGFVLNQKRPNNYPEDFFSRIPLPQHIIRAQSKTLDRPALSLCLPAVSCLPAVHVFACCLYIRGQALALETGWVRASGSLCHIAVTLALFEFYEWAMTPHPQTTRYLRLVSLS